MKKLTILVDVDSIVADLTTPWFDAYNREYDDDMTLDRVTTWNTHDHTKPECGVAIYKYLTPELIGGLEPIPGSQAALKELYDQGHRILFLTAVYNMSTNANARVAWIQEHFPWASQKDIILAHEKTLIKGDVLIDDKPSTLLAYHKIGPETLLMTIAYPYNTEAEEIAGRFGSWREYEKAWKEMVVHITNHSFLLSLTYAVLATLLG